MQKMTITIPQQYNDGKLIPIAIMDRISTDILNLFGGYSRYGIGGAWTDDSGKVYQDESFRYEMLMHDIHADYDYADLKVFAHDLCSILDQKCILTTCQDIQVDFIE